MRPLLPRPACVASLARPAQAFSARNAATLSLLGAARRQMLPRLTAAPVTRRAGFHTTPKRAILPALPQTVEGNVNDPVHVPDPHPTHGSYHWSFERVVAAALVPLTIAPFAAGSMHPILDATFCGLLVIHSHFGFQALIIDYLPSKRVPKSRKAASWALNAGTVLVAVGLYEFETNDVGVTEATKRIWTA